MYFWGKVYFWWKFNKSWRRKHQIVSKRLHFKTYLSVIWLYSPLSESFYFNRDLLRNSYRFCDTSKFIPNKNNSSKILIEMYEKCKKNCKPKCKQINFDINIVVEKHFLNETILEFIQKKICSYCIYRDFEDWFRSSDL